MLKVTTPELIVLFGSMFLFLVAPGVLSMFDAIRQRRLARVAAIPAAPPLAALAPAPAAQPLEPDFAPLTEPPPAPVAAPVPVPPVARTAPEFSSQPPAETAGRFSFQLGLLRPLSNVADATAGADPDLLDQGQQAAARHRESLGEQTIQADFEPASACFAGAALVGGRLRLRYLLFTDLWPSSAGDAAGRLIVEVDESGDSLSVWIA